MVLIEEVWKSVGTYGGIDYTGLYEVSNTGKVRSIDRFRDNNGTPVFIHGKEISPFVTCLYKRVHLCKDGKARIASVHRLVAMAFVNNPNPDKYKEVNRIDEDKLNNNADNLEWCTRSYNQKYYADRHPYEMIQHFYKDENQLHIREKNECVVCGAPTFNKRYCSVECMLKDKRSYRPNRDELKRMIRNNSFSFIGKEFGVNGNAVRKWCKYYGLPYKTSEISSYSDAEYELM